MEVITPTEEMLSTIAVAGGNLEELNLSEEALTQIRNHSVDTVGDEWMPPTQRDLVKEEEEDADKDEE
jgi:hypothetical protein